MLSALFSLIPLPLRTACSFDTWFVDGPLSRLRYWAVGLPADRNRRLGLIAFDLAEGRFRGDLDEAPASAFERWLAQTVDRESLPVDLEHRLTVGFWLGERLEGRTPEEAPAIKSDEDLFDEFMAANRSVLEERVRCRLERQLRPPLADRLVATAVAWLLRQGVPALTALQAGFPAGEVAEWLGSLLADPAYRPDSQELRALEEFAGEHNDSSLQLICLRWMQCWQRLAAMLESVSEPAFRQFAAWALRTVSFRLKWRVQRQAEGWRLGPVLAWDEEGRQEGEGLLSALLGMPLHETPSDGDKEPGRRWLPALLRRSPRIPAEEMGLSSTVGADRLLCLLELLHAETRDT